MVMRVADVGKAALLAVLADYGIELELLDAGERIPGSYWGDSEAGLIGNRLFVRADTPIHSVLHEASHFICATPERRRLLDRDAGGDDAEECAVCYLQLLLAAKIPQVGTQRLMQDMDSWGYSFRLGSTAAWFEQDALDAGDWLRRHGLLDATGMPSGRLRC